MGQEMNDYKKATLQMIRERGGRLDEKDDDELAGMYHEWSEETANAGWLMHSERGIAAFYEWATTAPCDRKRPNAGIHRPRSGPVE